MSIEYDEYVAKHFPSIDPGVDALGDRVLVQLRIAKSKTDSGIVLVQDTRDFNKENTALARVVSMGPLAYKNRDTAQEWPEGMWVSVGDIVMVTRWGGSRFEVPLPAGDVKTSIPGFDLSEVETEKEYVVFALFRDYEIQSKVRAGFHSLDQIL